MQTLDGGSPLPIEWRGGIVALGNFDGVHLGHQAVVARAFERARRAGRPALVVTFDPHPVRYFRPDAPPFRLTTVAQRSRLLADVGIDATVVVPFDALLAGLDAADFFRLVLVERLGIAGLVTGEGFQFGRGRGGDVAMLQQLGQPVDVEVEAEVPVTLGGETVSSTRIREAIRAGDVVAAADLLSRPFVVESEARPHDGGTSLALDDYVRPPAGTYRVRVRVRDGKRTWRGHGRIIEGANEAEGDRISFSKRFGPCRVEVELLHRTRE